MMGSSIAKIGMAAAIFLSSASLAVAQQQRIVPGQQAANSPTCKRLVGQLSALDRGNADLTRAAQIRRAEDAVNKQQYEVDQMVSRARRLGCENSGFFSIFSNPPRECSGLNRRIDQQRNVLDRLQNQLEQLNGGTTERAAQRQSLLIALANNGCGSQYSNAARAGRQGGFFDRLFGGGTIVSPGASGPMGNTYRTVCVRLGDGYYFPISFETTPNHFQQDAATCQRECPAAEVRLYTYHNPGEDMSQAVSLNGQFYSELPSAFSYRKKLSGYSCRRPGQSWYEALVGNGADRTARPGDIIVTNKKAQQQQGKAAMTDAGKLRGSEDALAQTPGKSDGTTHRKVRQVGPKFLQSDNQQNNQ
ncbi:MAG: DUF2865 domain-containing protein [Pseudolabrys sp.]